MAALLLLLLLLLLLGCRLMRRKRIALLQELGCSCWGR